MAHKVDVHVLELPGDVQVAVLDGMLLLDVSVPAGVRAQVAGLLGALQAPQNQEELDRIIGLVYTTAGPEVE